MESLDARASRTAAARLPPGSKMQRMLLSRAARFAREAGDFRQEYSSLHDLLRAASLADDPDDFLPAFVRALTLADDHPAELPVTGSAGDLLRHYWRAISILNGSLTTSYEDIVKALDDMERRHVQAGEGLRGLLGLRLGIAEQHGRTAEAADLRIRITTAGAARIETCRQCAKYREAERLFQTGQYHEGLQEVNLAWRNGAACSHQPQRIMSESLLKVLFTKHVDTADRWQRESLARTPHTPGSIGMIADHVTYLTVRWRYVEALQLLERHIELIPRARLYPALQVRFLVGAAICLDAVSIEVDPSKYLAAFEADSIRTALSIPPDSAATAQVLGPACWRASIDLARKIDRRAGTSNAFYDYVVSLQDYARREQDDHDRRRATGEIE